MAPLAAHVPFFDCFRFDVVVHGVTAVAKRARRPFHIVGRIKPHPPIRIRLDEICTPQLVTDIPLRGEWEVVITDLLEVTLLPFCAVNERHIIQLERQQRIGFRKIGNDNLRPHFRICYDIRHSCLRPSFIDGTMTVCARARTDVRARRRLGLRMKIDRNDQCERNTTKDKEDLFTHSRN